LAQQGLTVAAGAFYSGIFPGCRAWTDGVSRNGTARRKPIPPRRQFRIARGRCYCQPPIMALSASPISARALLTEGRVCTLLHQAAYFGRPSSGDFAPNPGSMFV